MGGLSSAVQLGCSPVFFVGTFVGLHRIMADCEVFMKLFQLLETMGHSMTTSIWINDDFRTVSGLIDQIQPGDEELLDSKVWHWRILDDDTIVVTTV